MAIDRNNPLVRAIGSVFSRALEGAAEAVLEEVQDRIDDAGERVSTARTRIKSQRERAPRRHREVIDVEVVNSRRH